MWKLVGVIALMVLMQLGVGSGSLCKRCSCFSGGIVNCAGKDLDHVPVMTADDIGQIGMSGIISFKNNEKMVESGERLEDYYPHITLFEFDVGSPLCEQITEFARGWSGVKIYGCSLRIDLTTEQTTTTSETGKNEKRNVPSEREESSEVKSLKKSWVVNTVFGWIALVASAVTSSLILRWCYIRRNGDRNVQAEMQRINAFLRRYYGQRRLREFGINQQLPGDRLPRAARRPRDDVLYAPPVRDPENVEVDQQDNDDDEDAEVILRPPVL